MYLLRSSNHLWFFRINFNSLWSEWLERIKKNVSEHYYFSIHVAKTKSNCYVSGLHYIDKYELIFQLKFEHMQAKTTTISLQCLDSRAKSMEH